MRRERQLSWLTLGVLALSGAIGAFGYVQVVVGIFVGMFLGVLYARALLLTIPPEKRRL